MKVWIKGAGDLASGIACRLYEAGFELIMSELPVPTTVRRTVAFSPAVYQREALVEGKKGVYCETVKEIKDALLQKWIPVVVDPDQEFLHWYQPDVVVDAILAKVNLGTTMEEAKIVVAVGPGFEAGVDCHCNVESMRGHNLGRCIYEGSALADTGVPGDIGGYTKERIIRATEDGVFKGAVSIGDKVQRGQIVGYAGEEPIYSQIDGIVRGLLQDDVFVKKEMKSGDVDPRCEQKNCFTVSDKARSIGGGVLEAILHLEQKRSER